MQLMGGRGGCIARTVLRPTVPGPRSAGVAQSVRLHDKAEAIGSTSWLTDLLEDGLVESVIADQSSCLSSSAGSVSQSPGEGSSVVSVIPASVPVEGFTTSNSRVNGAFGWPAVASCLTAPIKLYL